MKSSRFNSRSACSITSSGGFASSRRVRNCSACSSPPPSASPSSRWIALSCERRYARRCASENCDATSFCSLCWICGDLELRRDVLLHGAHPFFDIELFEQRLLLRDIDIEIRREKIGELLGILDVQDHHARLLRRVRRQLEQTRSRIAQVPERGFPFLARRRQDRLRQIDFGAQKGIGRDDFAE